MLNRSASLAMSTSVLKALPGKLDIKRHSPCILYFSILHDSKVIISHVFTIRVNDSVDPYRLVFQMQASESTL